MSKAKDFIKIKVFSGLHFRGVHPERKKHRGGCFFRSEAATCYPESPAKQEVQVGGVQKKQLIIVFNMNYATIKG